MNILRSYLEYINDINSRTEKRNYFLDSRREREKERGKERLKGNNSDHTRIAKLNINVYYDKKDGERKRGNM